MDSFTRMHIKQWEKKGKLVIDSKSKIYSLQEICIANYVQNCLPIEAVPSSMRDLIKRHLASLKNIRIIPRAGRIVYTMSCGVIGCSRYRDELQNNCGYHLCGTCGYRQAEVSRTHRVGIVSVPLVYQCVCKKCKMHSWY